MNSPWYFDVESYMVYDNDPEDWFFKSYFRESDFKVPFQAASVSGNVEDFEELKKITLSYGLKMFRIGKDRTGEGGWSFVDDSSFVHIDKYSNRKDSRQYSLQVRSFDEKIYDKYWNDVKDLFVQDSPVGQVKAMIQTSHGITLADIGSLDHPFVPENYEEDVADAYRHIQKELETDNPCGRIVLLDGLPGTGKSFFIKSLISDSSALFVFVPANLIGSLSGPNLLGTLMEAGNNESKQPLVLVLEDADKSLVTRAQDNLGELSEILNLSDGILGELFDIRLIATTNAKSIDIDPALMRPGRLCRQIHIDDLNMTKAEDIYKRLTGKDLDTNGQRLTLAEVYKLARDEGWEPPSIEDKRVGFRAGSDLAMPRVGF